MENPLELEKVLGHRPYYWWVRSYWTSRGEKLDFQKHKYLEQIYKDQSPIIVSMKSGQTGWTERMLTEALWLPDQFKENSLYLFPTATTLSDLVQERVDDPINNHPYLQRVSGRAKRLLGKQADKMSLKRMSKGFAYFRGSNNATQITSVAADAIFVDELDRMEVTNVPYFDKRLEHSNRKWERWASTPTVPDFGIHKKYLETDRHEYHIKCNHCNQWQVLSFEDNIDKEAKLLICRSCKKQLIPWECQCEWVAANPQASIRGYHISGLYSPKLDVAKLVSLSNKTVEWEIRQFYNQSLGLPYEEKGSKITEDMIHAAMREYLAPTTVNEPCYMGVDVGRVLHVIIRTKKRVIHIDTVKNFTGVGSLQELARKYEPKGIVIDALPETRKVQEFIALYKGRCRMCYYSGLTKPKEGEWYQSDGDVISTERTLSLDVTSNQIQKQFIELPKNIDTFVDFKQHLKNLVRVVREDKGKTIAEYVQTGDDHFYHALNYATMASEAFDIEVTEPEFSWI